MYKISVVVQINCKYIANYAVKGEVYFCIFYFHQLFGYPTGLGALIVRNGKQLNLEVEFFL